MSWCNDWDRDNCGCDRDRDKESCYKKVIIKKECCDRDSDRDGCCNRDRCYERRRRFCFCGIFRCKSRRRGCGNDWDRGCDNWGGKGGCGCGW